MVLLSQVTWSSLSTPQNIRRHSRFRSLQTSHVEIHCTGSMITTSRRTGALPHLDQEMRTKLDGVAEMFFWDRTKELVGCLLLEKSGFQLWSMIPLSPHTSSPGNKEMTSWTTLFQMLVFDKISFVSNDVDCRSCGLGVSSIF
jgi:hypothetical protein